MKKRIAAMVLAGAMALWSNRGKGRGIRHEDRHGY